MDGTSLIQGPTVPLLVQIHLEHGIHIDMYLTNYMDAIYLVYG